MQLQQSDKALDMIKNFNNNRFDAKIIILCKIQAAQILENVMNLQTNKLMHYVLHNFGKFS
jgi:hypothetical protein